MSNAWVYTFLVPDTPKDTIVQRPLSLSEDLGFVPRSSSDNAYLNIVSADGLHIINTQDSAEAREYLQDRGGLIQMFYKDSLDIGIEFTWSPPVSAFSVTVDSVHFQSYPDKVNNESILSQLFHYFCESMIPRYAYSTDERMLSRYPNEYRAVQECIVNFKPIPIVSWINFFASAYASNLNLSILKEYGGSFSNNSYGIFLSFAATPSEISIDRWIVMNERWKTQASLPEEDR